MSIEPLCIWDFVAPCEEQEAWPMLRRISRRFSPSIVEYPGFCLGGDRQALKAISDERKCHLQFLQTSLQLGRVDPNTASIAPSCPRNLSSIRSVIEDIKNGSFPHPPVSSVEVPWRCAAHFCIRYRTPDLRGEKTHSRGIPFTGTSSKIQ